MAFLAINVCHLDSSLFLALVKIHVSRLASQAGIKLLTGYA